MPVTGIGGFFFRSRDPKALAAWYRENLGINAGSADVWDQEAGPTVFAPFKEDTKYFADDKRFMLNMRVSGMEALCADLRKKGVEVIIDPESADTEYGKFARVHDPEGNAIELWEPPAE
jgi:predicted enzyme related to lactoylglutathione lyase